MGNVIEITTCLAGNNIMCMTQQRKAVCFSYFYPKVWLIFCELQVGMQQMMKQASVQKKGQNFMRMNPDRTLDKGGYAG